MIVRITAGELIDSGHWERACEMLGINLWAVNEGLMDSAEWLELTAGQAAELGLLPRIDHMPGDGSNLEVLTTEEHARRHGFTECS